MENSNTVFDLTDTELDAQISASCEELSMLERDSEAFDAACEYRAELSLERRCRRNEAREELAAL